MTKHKQHINKKDLSNLFNKVTKSKSIKTLVASALVASVITPSMIINVPTAEAYSGGQGTVSSPYIISTPEDLNQMRNNPIDHFKLVNDIDITGIYWTVMPAFSGTLDGQNYNIIGAKISGTTENVGFFHSLTGATIKNVHFKNISVKNTGVNKHYTGGLAGSSSGVTKISNVSVTGVVSGKGYYTGGLLGSAIFGTEIINSYSAGEVSGETAVGGLVGNFQANKGFIKNSFSTSNVQGRSEIGGLVGKIGSTLENVYSTGNVTTTHPDQGGIIGGLIGTTISGETTVVSNAYTTGQISGLSPAGGIIGEINSGLYYNLFALNSSVTGNNTTTTGKVVGKTGSSTFTSVISMIGMKGNGHAKHITGDLLPQDLMKRATYESEGFEFGRFNPAIWGIDENTSLPYLLSNIQKNFYDPGKGEWYDPATKPQPPVIPTLSVSTTSITKNSVVVTANFPSDATTKEIKIGSSSWTTYTNPVSISDNTTVQARGANGSVYSPVAEVTITNIDKLSPNPATFSLSNSFPTNQDVVVTVNYPGDANTKEYKLASESIWKSYSTPITLTKNDSIYARSTDLAGNTSTESRVDVTNINKQSLTIPTFSPSTTSTTNQDLKVTVNYPVGATTKEYRVNNGSWLSYTSPVVFSSNGKLEARGSDVYGNVSPVGVYDITNIDKSVPDLATLTPNIVTPTNENVIVTIDYPIGVTTKQYKIGTSGSWGTYTSPLTVTNNETIFARSINSAGTISQESSLIISNIDKTPPTAATITASETNPTNQDVIVIISYPSDATTKQYKIDGGAWLNYTSDIVFTQNGKIEAQSFDLVGNNSPISTYNITNIVKATPEITLSEGSKIGKEQEVNVSISGITPSLKKFSKGSNDTTYFQSNGTTFTGSRFTVADRGIYTVYATDAVGNNVVKEINVVNIDKEAPVITVDNLEEGQLYTTEITPTITVTDLNSPTYTATLNGASYTGSEIIKGGKYNLAVNAKDVANNTATKTITFEINLSPIKSGTIDNQNLSKTQSKEIDLINHFSDPEDDNLTYKVTSSNPSVVKITGSGNKLNLEGLVDGTTTIDVIAEDANSTSDAHTFNVLVSATTLQDLIDSGVTDINPDLEDEYLDAIDEYVKPPTLEDLQDIIDMVNQANRVRLDLTQSDVTKLESMVLALKTSLTKDKYTIVHKAYNSMHQFELDMIDSKFTRMQTVVNTVTALSKPYMDKMVIAFDKTEDYYRDRLDSTFTIAQTVVATLDSGLLKDRLTAILNAIKAVEDAKKNPTDETISNGRDEVAKLPDGELKDQLEKELEDLANSIKPVVIGEVHAIYVDETDKVLSPAIVVKDVVGKPYTTNSVVIPDYELFRVIGNEDSLITNGITTVKYIYKKVVKPDPIVYGEVHVTYVDDSGAEVKPKKVINNKVGSSYITEAANIPGFRHISTTGSETGSIAKTVTDVTYHYEAIVTPPAVIGEVHISYVDENNKEIKTTKVLKDQVGTVYAAEAPHINGYTFLSVLGDEIGKIKNTTTSVIYSYVRDPNPPVAVMGEVHISYVDENMVEIKSKKVVRKEVGETYLTEPIVIAGYDYVSVIGNENGTISSAQTNIVYTYKKQVATAEGEVHVIYLDEKLKEIKTIKILKGKVGSVYTTEAPYIAGYTFSTISGSEVGKIDSTLTSVVYHYKKEPTPPQIVMGEVHVNYMDENMKELKSKKVIREEVGKAYSLEPSAINGYEYVSVSGNENGVITSSQTNVVYSYKKQELQPSGSGELRISYLDENGSSLKPKKIIQDKLGTIYVTEGPYIKGYALESIKGHEVGKLTDLLTTVTYNYEKDLSSGADAVGEVHVSYVDDSLKALKSKQVIKNKMGEPYETSPAEIKGYSYDNVVGEETGVINSYQTNVVYVYGKENTQPGVTDEIHVSYLDKEGNPLKPKKVIKGVVGEAYVVEPVAIKGYKYISAVGNESGLITTDNINIVYFYDKEVEPPVLGEVSISYLDKNLKGLKPKKTIKGEIGTDYSTEPPFIRGYNYLNASGDQEGKFDSTLTSVVYHYEKNSDPGVTVMGEVHITYLDERGEEIKSTTFIRNKVGTVYTSKAPSIKGYELVDIEGDQNGKIQEEVIKVVYKYKSSNTEVLLGEVDVHYLDEKGQPIFTKLTIKDNIGAQYTTRLLPIAGYDFVNVVGNAQGKVTDTVTVVTYNYKKTGTESTFGEVQVRYIDEYNKDLKERLIIRDKIGVPYVTSKVDIEGYDFISSTGDLNGKIKEGTSYALYVYKKTDPNKNPNATTEVSVSYVDDQDRELSAKTVTKGKQGEYYSVKPVDIKDYKWLKTVGAESGLLGSTKVEVKYVYKKTQTLEPLPSNPGDNTASGKSDTGTVYFEVDKREVFVGEEIKVKFKIQSLTQLSSAKFALYSKMKNTSSSNSVEVAKTHLNQNINGFYEGTLNVKFDKEGDYGLSGLFTNNHDNKQTIETNTVSVKVKEKVVEQKPESKPETPDYDLNKVLPELKGFKTAIMRTSDNTELYELNKTGSFVKVAEVAKDTILRVYDTYKDYYKLTNGLYVKKGTGTVYVGQGEARKGNVKVYDDSGKVTRTLSKDQEYKVYAFNSQKYIIGNGEHVKAEDFNAYIFGWIQLKKDLTLYDRTGKVSRTLKAKETYRVFAVDKDSLNLGGGYKVKKKDDSYKFIIR